MRVGSGQVALVVLDGLGTDGIETANTPALDRLLSSGAHTKHFTAVSSANSLIGHTALLYSVGPNEFPFASRRDLTESSTYTCLFEAVRNTDRQTLMYYSWDELRQVVPTESLDEMHFKNISTFDDDRSEQQLFTLAGERAKQGEFGLLYAYYGSIDTVGHIAGWNSDGYFKAIEKADQALSKLVDQLPGDCLVIVTSYHGGFVEEEDRHKSLQVPLIIAGPNATAGSVIERPSSVVDIAPTIAHQLGMPVPATWRGAVLDM